mmetsp:Transcript_49320/g.139635  ORF Transcript_49320/g.139635 Transcript_49320/m.139635 type:complete len:157 (+) Transcript_49320:258-728(+)
MFPVFHQKPSDQPGFVPGAAAKKRAAEPPSGLFGINKKQRKLSENLTQFAFVYQLWRPGSTLRYVGSTLRTLKIRGGEHWKALEANKHSSPDLQYEYNLWKAQCSSPVTEVVTPPSPSRTLPRLFCPPLRVGSDPSARPPTPSAAAGRVLRGVGPL